MKSNTNEVMKAKGLRAFQVWIPCGLYTAVRDKLYNDRKTSQATMTKLLSLWTGWKPDEEKTVERPTDDPAGRTASD